VTLMPKPIWGRRGRGCGGRVGSRRVAALPAGTHTHDQLQPPLRSPRAARDRRRSRPGPRRALSVRITMSARAPATSSGLSCCFSTSALSVSQPSMMDTRRGFFLRDRPPWRAKRGGAGARRGRAQGSAGAAAEQRCARRAVNARAGRAGRLLPPQRIHSRQYQYKGPLDGPVCDLLAFDSSPSSRPSSRLVNMVAGFLSTSYATRLAIVIKADRCLRVGRRPVGSA
jgi:hypothetical protein